MDQLQIVISGTDADAAAEPLTSILAEGEAPGVVTRIEPSQLPEPARKVIDPVSLAGVILAIPGAVLAVADGIERIRKRRKAQALIEQAKRLTQDHRVHILVVTADGGTVTLQELDPDRLLALGAPDR
jgi:ABC-type Fe2+-enterobactin transport system substrate-binding protein